MLGAIVESGQDHTGLGRDHCGFVVLARERSHGVQRIEPHDRHELDLVTHAPAEKLNAAATRNLATLNAMEYLGSKQ